MFNTGLLESKLSVPDMYRFSVHRKREFEKDPEQFMSFGTIIFCGLQGSGKSLSAFQLIRQICDNKPNVKIISNVGISFHDYIQYEGIDTVLNTNNGTKGIILFLDEIGNQFPSAMSKEISADWFTITNMQRKRRLLIIGTTPVFSRLAKPFREQFEYACLCTQKFNGLVQDNYWFKCNVESTIIGDSDEENTHNMELVKHHYFSISVEDITRYDTTEIVGVVKSKDRDERKGRG